MFFDTFLKKWEMDKNVDFSTSFKRDAHFQGSRAPKSEEISILGLLRIVHISRQDLRNLFDHFGHNFGSTFEIKS